MHPIRPDGFRVERFGRLKEHLPTRRDRLPVGIDIAKAQHMAQVRHTHTQILDKSLTIPNPQADSAEYWERLHVRRAATGSTEIICALDPTGTCHAVLAQSLETHGVDVVLDRKSVV